MVRALQVPSALALYKEVVRSVLSRFLSLIVICGGMDVAAYLKLQLMVGREISLFSRFFFAALIVSRV